MISGMVAYCGADGTVVRFQVSSSYTVYFAREVQVASSALAIVWSQFL